MFHGQYIWLTFAYKDDESIVSVTWTLVRLHGLFVRAVFIRSGFDNLCWFVYGCPFPGTYSLHTFAIH